MTRRYAFLPGASGSGSFWDPVQTLVAESDPTATCISIDWPGFGDVPADSRIKSYTDLANLAIEQLSGPTVLVAQSMGGFVATLIWQQRPDLVSHLVFAATSAGVDMQSLGATDWRPGSQAANPQNPAWMWDPTPDLTTTLQSITVKTLLVWATEDQTSPLAVGQHLSMLIPRARLHAFETNDHWVAREFATEVAPAIVELATPHVGFLHTAEAHVDTFEALIDAAQPGGHLATIHLVNEQLLADAWANGVASEELEADVLASLEEMIEHNADLIICTCSTISGLAERLGTELRVPVMRVDRPMAAAAVATGNTIAVVASVESTIEPTLALLQEEAARQGKSPQITSEPCYEAWALFASGDTEGYERAVATHVEKLANRYDSIVLAQVSMLGAQRFISSETASSGAAVFVSPPAAVRAALDLIAD